MKMKFRSLRLQNWMNFAQVHADIGDRLFLVGPNASGKSNLLAAFRFLRDLGSTGGRFQEAMRRRGGVSAIRCLAARRYPNIEIHVALEGEDASSRWEYELAFNQDSQRRPLVRKERVRRAGEWVLERPTAEDRHDPLRLTQTYLEQVNVNQPFRELATFFASIRYLHIVPQLVREPDRSIGRANDPFGGDFLEQVAKTPEKTQKARLRRIRLMGLLWAILDKAGPLLLEEPELSLHPEILQALPQMLARVQRRSGRQIFLTTHSPDPLGDEGIGLDEVLLLRPSTEGTEVTAAGSHVEGITDEAVVRRLITYVGAQPGTVYGRQGKPHLRERITGYNNAARHAPWIVLVEFASSCWQPDRAARNSESLRRAVECLRKLALGPVAQGADL